MLGGGGFLRQKRFPTGAAGRESAPRDVISGRGTGLASLWRYLLAGLGLAALLAGILAVVYLTAPQTAQLAGADTSRSKTTANGLFVASFQPERGVVRQGELQSWLLTLKTVAGAPVEGAAITVSGGMPQHNHGLPTSPQATDYLGDGRYRIDGREIHHERMVAIAVCHFRGGRLRHGRLQCGAVSSR